MISVSRMELHLQGVVCHRLIQSLRLLEGNHGVSAIVEQDDGNLDGVQLMNGADVRQFCHVIWIARIPKLADEFPPRRV